MSEGRNFLLAIFLSFMVLTLYNMWRGPIEEAAPVVKAESNEIKPAAVESPSMPVLQLVERQKALTSTERVAFESPSLVGSINLETGDIDDVTLKNYRQDTSPNSGRVVLLSPQNTHNGYWVNQQVVSLNAGQMWSVVSKSDKRITIATENKQCRVERTFEFDDHYMVRATDKVIAKEATHIRPSWTICRRTVPEASNMTVHEGAVGVIGGRLQELAYKDLKASFNHKGGWLGFTDKYWLVALVPSDQEAYSSQYDSSGSTYTCKMSAGEQALQPGMEWNQSINIFVGAKELHQLDAYEKNVPIDRFDLAVDFGWFYFITKPLFYALQYINQLCGSLGLAILLMTVISKLLVFPLSRKSYRAMERMKAVAPKMELLRARYKDDPTRMQQEIWALYKKEKANPLSGCLPQLLQMPLFFCLYKVFSVSLEMRHAPFMGWIDDLSMPDPTHVLNLFGLLPFTPPEFMHIGLWPLLMGLTMVWQQRMAPQATDPVQARMMWIMPVMFVFLFSGFPAGVVLFWTLSNVIAIAQQLWEKRCAKN